jgi:hypothetical protein
MTDMQQPRTHAVAGISITGSKVKANFGADMTLLSKRLWANGASDVRITRLPTPMTRLDAAKFLLEQKEFQDTLAQEALNKVVLRHTPKTKTVASEGTITNTTENIMEN